MSSAHRISAHPAADLFPLIDGAEFDALCEDIRANGLRDPIVRMKAEDGTWLVLDGRNRLRACAQVGVEPAWNNYGGDDPVAYVISKNLRRRHLDESQRAMVSSRLAELAHGSNRFSAKKVDAQIQASTAEPPVTQAKAASLLNVSRSSVQSARKVIAQGVPELVAAVDSGAIKVSKAARIADLAPEEQRKALEPTPRDEETATMPEPEQQRTPHHRSVVGQQNRDNVRKLHEQGLTIREIANELDLSRSTVKQIKNKIGISVTNPLRKLLELAGQAAETWSFQASSAAAINSATKEQRADLLARLDDEIAAAKRLRRILQREIAP